MLQLLVWWPHVGRSTYSLWPGNVRATQELISLSPTDGQHSYPVLLSKANPSSYVHLTQSPLATQKQASVILSLPHILRTFSSFLDHSHQPTNTPLFLLSLITSKSLPPHTHTHPYSYTPFLGNETQNSCLSLDTQVLLHPWGLKFSPARFPPLPHTIKRAPIKVTRDLYILYSMVNIHLWHGFIGQHSLLIFLPGNSFSASFGCSPSFYKVRVPRDSVSSHFTLPWGSHSSHDVNLMLTTPRILCNSLLNLRLITSSQPNTFTWMSNKYFLSQHV